MSCKLILMQERVFKLIVHVPSAQADAVHRAIGDAGGGATGEYTHCSFTHSGTGRFKPTDKAAPHIGSAGKLETLEEECIEVSHIPLSKVKQVVAAMIEAHPYEETAYQLIEHFNVEDL